MSTPHAGSSSSRGAGSAAAGEEPQQHILVSHGTTGTHFLLEQQQQQKQQQQSHRDQQQHTSSSSSSSGSAGHAGDADGSLMVNMWSAAITAAVTALVEAPLELFRHNSQAGQLQGNFVRAMWRTLRRSGPRSLYFGFMPYLFESLPYDFSELLVVGAGKGGSA
jgi:hypothetical protein